MTVDINKLNELYEKTQTADGYEAISKAILDAAGQIFDAWPFLYKELIAGRKMRKELRHIGFSKKLGEIFAEYDNALKE